ncbi:MAG: alkaline phosphatase family protein [Rhizomicrobium sp.]
MRTATLTLLFTLATAAAQPAWAGDVLMISVDGLRPLDVIEAQSRGLTLPNLTAMLDTGAYATGVRNVLPTVTYPNHTTLITGVAPAVHGISNNLTFDPLGRNFQGWYWYASDIRVPTLWDAVHAAHKPVASVSWPVSVGSPSIDYNLPEYWRALTKDDLKLLRALSTPGLIAQVEKDTGVTLAATFGETPDADAARARAAGDIFVRKHPRFMTLHLVALDATQHEFGPGTPEARATLEKLDAAIGTLAAAARKADPHLDIAIVSDHGFVAIQHDVNLMTAFVTAGLVTLDPATHKIVSWQAEPWDAGGSAAVVLANPDDQAVKDKVSALLTRLAADPANGIARVIGKEEIARMGGGKEASFWIDFALGYESGSKLEGPLVTAGTNKGTHGFFPDHLEMRSTFMIEGPDVKKRGSLGDIDMRDIAPTLAKLMGVKLPSATGKALW